MSKLEMEANKMQAHLESSGYLDDIPLNVVIRLSLSRAEIDPISSDEARAIALRSEHSDDDIEAWFSAYDDRHCLLFTLDLNLSTGRVRDGVAGLGHSNIPRPPEDADHWEE